MTTKFRIISSIAMLSVLTLVGSSVLHAATKPTPKVKSGTLCPKPLPKKAVAVKPTVWKPVAAAKTTKPAVVKKTPKILDLGATSCIPCKLMAPVLEGLAKDYKGKLTVEFIDVWKNPAKADQYKIQSIPTQIFYDTNGKEFYRHTGFFPKEDILKVFKEKGIKLSK